jgi:hypothetical protein
MVLQLTKKTSLTSSKHDSSNNTTTLHIEVGGTQAIPYGYLTYDTVYELTCVCVCVRACVCVCARAVAGNKLFPTPNTRGNRLVYIPLFHLKTMGWWR